MGFINSASVVHLLCANYTGGCRSKTNTEEFPGKEGSLRNDENVMSVIEDFGSKEKQVQRVAQLDLGAGVKGRLSGGGGF